MDIRIEWGQEIDLFRYEAEEWYYSYFMVAIDTKTKEELGRVSYNWREDGVDGPGTPSKEDLECYMGWIREQYPEATVTCW